MLVVALALVGCKKAEEDPDPVPTIDPPCEQAAWFDDTDGDGFGDPTAVRLACDAPTGTVSNGEDCDDAAASINPDADEVCNGIDDDCDGRSDSDDADVLGDLTVYEDTDGDGFGNPSTEVLVCVALAGFVSNADDCDDTSATTNPTAEELCNGADDDCDGLVDDADDTLVDAVSAFIDLDADGFGAGPPTGSFCEVPIGFVGIDGDCDDEDPAVNPDGVETCNAIDDDCDGNVDDTGGSTPVDATPVFEDADGDGVGAAPLDAKCTPGVGDVLVDGDCDDADSARFPGAAEVCDGIDNDCADDGDVLGVTFFPSAGGPAVDLTADLSVGTSTIPVLWDAPESGSLGFCGGTWFVNVTATDRTLSAAGYDVGGMPVLDGAGAAPVFAVVDTDLVLTDLSITGGLGNGTHTSTFAYGGGVHCDSGSLVGTRLDVYGNSGDLGGGIGSYLCDATITDSAIHDNMGLSFAGGIFQDGDTLTVQNSTITSNTAAFFGGGIYLFGTNESTEAQLTDTSITDNTAGSGGAALLAYADADATCTATGPGTSVIARNDSPTAAVHIALETSSFQSNGCDFQDPGPDDNGTSDIYAETLDESTAVGNDATLTCTGTLGCLVAP